MQPSSPNKYTQLPPSNKAYISVRGVLYIHVYKNIFIIVVMMCKLALLSVPQISPPPNKHTLRVHTFTASCLVGYTTSVHCHCSTSYLAQLCKNAVHDVKIKALPGEKIQTAQTSQPIKLHLITRHRSSAKHMELIWLWKDRRQFVSQTAKSTEYEKLQGSGVHNKFEQNYSAKMCLTRKNNSKTQTLSVITSS